MIKTENLSKKYNHFWALNDLNLDIKKGEFYCLLGPNGAGKTTTLKLLAGLLKATAGTIYICGKELKADATEIKQLLGYIPDSPYVYENLTVREFLEFIGSIFNIEKKLLGERIDYYLDVFDLNNAEGSLLRDFSHGMRQRVIYIANFIHHPQVFLIDEPLVGLDPHAIHLIKRLLKEKTREGLTILMCTHILGIAEELADRIGIIDKGKLIAQGGLEELKKSTSQARLEDIFLRLTEPSTQNLKG
ncbi:ABC transporter ATP-binding protein [Candidatus Omnitrophota bacterium]